MKRYRLYGVILCGLFVGLFLSGCTYHTYYQDENAALPAGSYELKESVPISKEIKVERNYVVE